MFIELLIRKIINIIMELEVPVSDSSEPNIPFSFGFVLLPANDAKATVLSK
jgi:hypothetical protein